MENEAPTELSETDVYALLADGRRRLVLRALHDSSDPMTVRTAIDFIGEYECDDPSNDHLLSIHISLHHHHIPKLERFSVIAYDRDDGTISPGANFALLVGYLLEIDEKEWN